MKKIIFALNRRWIYFCALIIIAYFKLANRVKISGLESIPKKGGILIASNHVSMFETIIIPACILTRMPGEKIFAPAKAELFKIPLLDKILTSWGSFPVKRGSADIRAMKQIIEILKKEKVMMFPEGTRSKTGELGRGNRMLGRLILEAKPIVVPVRVFGAEKVLGLAGERPRPFSKITVKFGAPLNLESLYTDKGNRKELSQKVVDSIMDAIREIN